MKKFIIIAIILNVGILIYLLFFVDPVEEIDMEKYIYEKELKSKDGELYEIRNLEVEIQNYIEFIQAYNGQMPIEYVQDMVNNMLNIHFNTLYLETNTLNRDQKENYYENNKKDIAFKYGTRNLQDFIDLLDMIQIYKNNELQYTACEIDMTTYKQYDSDYVEFMIHINYNDNSKMSFKFLLSNYIDTEKQYVIVIPIKGGI